MLAMILESVWRVATWPGCERTRPRQCSNASVVSTAIKRGGAFSGGALAEDRDCERNKE